MSDVIAILGAGGPLADKVADAICDAVRKAGSLGELPEKAVRGVDGQQKLVRVPDQEWFERIAVASKAGVFDRREVGAVVDHILSTPAPTTEGLEPKRQPADGSVDLNRKSGVTAGETAAFAEQQ